MTKLEEIARAMQADAGKLADEAYWTTPCTGAVIWRALAKAALSALKTPTPEMIEAGQAVDGTVSAADVWSAMIDAAVGEGR